MTYIISYYDGAGLDHGRIKVSSEDKLEGSLDIALARIGTTLYYAKRRFEDRWYTFYNGMRYTGCIRLYDENNKLIKFPKPIHDKILNVKQNAILQSSILQDSIRR